MKKSLPTSFANLAALTKLPYFTPGLDGELVMEPSIGKAIDVHAHLCQGPIGRRTELLRQRTERTEEYLPPDAALDCEVYANRNFTPARLKELKQDLVFRTMARSKIKSTHTVPNLQRRMKALGIARSCILPIESPIGPSSTRLMREATQGASDLLCFGSVHPLQRDPGARVTALVATGARGIKYHPAVQLRPPNATRALPIYRAAGAAKVPVLWHCGPVGIELALGRRYSQVKLYEQPIAECPETTFVLGHSGALQFEEAVKLHQRYPNAWLEVSCQGLVGLRHVLERCDPARVMWGTDWPFYHQAFGLAKLLIATEGMQALRPKILRENAARLFGLAPAAIA